MEKHNKGSCWELAILSMQAQSKGVLALYLFRVNIHTVMMERALGAHMQEKESDCMDITSVLKNL